MGIFLISTIDNFYPVRNIKVIEGVDTLHPKIVPMEVNVGEFNIENKEYYSFDISYYKKIAFITTILNLIISLIIYILFDFSNNQFQFIQENLDLSFMIYI